jgi:hypothetical protein
MAKTMLRALVCLAALLALGASLLVCGNDLAGPGDFCDSDGDCQAQLVCRNNICVATSSGDCNPACQQDYETCFQGQCVAFGDPNDKDGDGSPVGQDCDDFNPSVLPGAHEYCDGVDNNCDGMTDEGCPSCDNAAVEPCSTDLGECVAGVRTCTNGRWQTCSGAGPMPELCDGKDNDCDGLTDEVCPCQAGDEFPCGAAVGRCAVGLQTCEAGVWSGCHNGELPQPETCNNQDDDCDGSTDDGFNLQSACTGVGICADGLIECAADFDVRCSSMPGGSADQSEGEVCDGLDNDCDGLTDESLEGDQAPNTCGMAQELGGLPDNVAGGSNIQVSGNLWPTGDEDWYKVTATDDVNEDLEDGCDSFHFAARFDRNPGALVMDIYTTSCAPESIECRATDAFNHYYDYQVAGGQGPGQCGCRGTDAASSQAGFNFCSADTKTFYIRVYAGPASVDTCETYQLTLSNGIFVAW